MGLKTEVDKLAVISYVLANSTMWIAMKGLPKSYLRTDTYNELKNIPDFFLFKTLDCWGEYPMTPPPFRDIFCNRTGCGHLG